MTRRIAQADLTSPTFTPRQITDVQLLQRNLHPPGTVMWQESGLIEGSFAKSHLAWLTSRLDARNA